MRQPLITFTAFALFACDGAPPVNNEKSEQPGEVHFSIQVLREVGNPDWAVVYDEDHFLIYEVGSEIPSEFSDSTPTNRIWNANPNCIMYEDIGWLSNLSGGNVCGFFKLELVEVQDDSNYTAHVEWANKKYDKAVRNQCPTAGGLWATIEVRDGLLAALQRYYCDGDVMDRFERAEPLPNASRLQSCKSQRKSCIGQANWPPALPHRL